MGDVGDYWREHREYQRSNGISRSRARPRAVYVAFKKKHEKMGFRQCSDWHWQAKINGEILDFWPSKSKWRYQGTTTEGDMKALEKFISGLAGKP